jgi:hypothetical protein
MQLAHAKLKQQEIINEQLNKKNELFEQSHDKLTEAHKVGDAATAAQHIGSTPSNGCSIYHFPFLKGKHLNGDINSSLLVCTFLGAFLPTGIHGRAGGPAGDEATKHSPHGGQPAAEVTAARVRLQVPELAELNEEVQQGASSRGKLQQCRLVA